MELAFRDVGAGDAGPGEVLVRPREARDVGRRDLATLVLQRGLEGLDRGGGPPSAVVVSSDPTLDDLLAASFAERLAEGGTLPAGAAALAKYAALQREGLQPGTVPVEESIEG